MEEEDEADRGFSVRKGLWLFVGALLFPMDAQAAPLPPLASKYCASCHLVPAPDALSREHWTQVFGFMSVWIRERNLPYEPEEYSALLREYIALAPERLEAVRDTAMPAGLLFESRPVGDAPRVERPVITDLRAADLDQDGIEEILVCDESSGRVSVINRREGRFLEEGLFDTPAPSRAVPLDYDGDGRTDLAVASLGTVQPTDQAVGAVWLLRNQGDGRYDPQTLLTGCARVSDVKPGDFNGDGKTDLLVIQFGWRTTGGVLWLEQRSPTEFVSHQIATVHGGLQAETVDLDGDGDLDFVVLFAQEHESLVLFTNDGSGRFTTRVIGQGDHPAWGSAGFTMVDLDRDGDEDFLWSNGDMMDEIPLVKPYHGLRWLENGSEGFVVHDLVRMPGCYRSAARDLDADGDLDIVVSSIHPQWEQQDFPSLIWLENDGTQSFTARKILYSPANLASLVVGDFDGDGLPDVLAGGMHIPGPVARVGRLTGIFGLKKEQPSASAGPGMKVHHQTRAQNITTAP
jgi:hypothetical protein